MPISPLYEWAETELTLEVRVQLQGASRSKADVFATDCMLKVNSPPYLLILDLFGEVDDSHSVVTLMPDCVLFQLRKVCVHAAQPVVAPAWGAWAGGCCTHCWVSQSCASD